MTNVLSTIILAISILFLARCQSKIETLQTKVDVVHVDLVKGSLCGKDKSGTWICDDLYEITIVKETK